MAADAVHLSSVSFPLIYVILFSAICFFSGARPAPHTSERALRASTSDQAMLLARVHRAWLLNERDMPTAFTTFSHVVGVVSLTDVINAIHTAETKRMAAAA